MVRLAPWTAMKVVPYDELRESRSNYLLLNRPGARFAWLPLQLEAEGRRPIPVAEFERTELLRCCSGSERGSR